MYTAAMYMLPQSDYCRKKIRTVTGDVAVFIFGLIKRGDIMFDKDLFLALCEKYDVELSKTAPAPMIREGDKVCEITINDIKRIFTP